MLSHIFKTTYLNHLGKKLSLTTLGLSLLGSLSLSNPAYAACPTPTPGTAVVQSGETCIYDATQYSNSDSSSAVIDINNGGTATFTENTTLHKARFGKTDGTYAAIFLRVDPILTNTAIFDGNVTVLPTPTQNARDIIVGGGSNLHIKGNLDISHGRNAGSMFSLNAAESTWHNERKDTSMVIDGDVIANGESGSFIRFGYGNFTFSKNVSLKNSPNGTISAFPNTAGFLTFKGETTIQNGAEFINIRETSNPTITFNKFTINNEGNTDIFILRGGKTSILGESKFNTPNAEVIKLHSTATFENGGSLTFTSKDGILVHSVAEAGKDAAIFNNLENGVISNEKSIALNDGAGSLKINNAGILTTTTDELFKNTADGTINAINSGTLTGFLTTTDRDTLNLVNDTKGVWNNTKDSAVDALVNKGTIKFIAPEDKASLTITADKYTGGGTLVMNTTWDDNGSLHGTSTSDKLKINTIEGDAVTTVKIAADKIGSIIQQDKDQFFVDVIEVANNHAGNLFVGTAATNNPQEAQLMREGNNYRWTLKAKVPAIVTPTQPDTPKYVDIISKPVVGYVQQPYVNQQMMLAQLGKLHERVGEQRYLGLNNAVAEKQLWARTNYDFTTLQGKQRFGMDVKSGFIQVGKDLAFNLNKDKSQQHTGVMFTYGWAKSKFFDKFRAENGQVIADKYTGKAHTDMLSLGGYHTYYSANGFYVDTVAQLSWLQNRYNSFDSKVKQNGWGFGASIEIGKAFPLLNPKLAIEPQAQLTYQRIWLNGLNDGVKDVKKASQDNVTARLGARVIWNESLENNASQFYFTANLIQTLKGRDSRINVGGENVSERYGDLSAEFGVGGQYPINPNLSLYADVRYVIGMQDHSQTHKNSQLSRQSYNGRIGLRYSF